MAKYQKPALAQEDDSQDNRFLTFLLGKEIYGIGIGSITEIVGMQAITQVPELPGYVRGVINLRGSVIPVMDIRLRFGKPPQDYDDRTCIIVTYVCGLSLGLIVDTVSEVLAIPPRDISDLPSFGASRAASYINRIGKWEDTVIPLLDCEKLLSEEEFEHIEEEFEHIDITL